MRIETSAYEVAGRFLGVSEVPGIVSNPLILGWLRIYNEWPKDDATAWCGAFAAFVCKTLGLPHPRSLAARAWLNVGMPILLGQAEAENDVVILSRGGGNQPGPDVTYPGPNGTVQYPPGHVTFFGGRQGDFIVGRGGNQSDSVTDAIYPTSQLLGVRRLA